MFTGVNIMIFHIVSNVFFSELSCKDDKVFSVQDIYALSMPKERMGRRPVWAEEDMHIQCRRYTIIFWPRAEFWR